MLGHADDVGLALVEVGEVKVFDVHGFAASVVARCSDVFVLFFATRFSLNQYESASFFSLRTDERTEACLSSSVLYKVALHDLVLRHDLNYFGLLVSML